MTQAHICGACRASLDAALANMPGPGGSLRPSIELPDQYAWSRQLPQTVDRAAWPTSCLQATSKHGPYSCTRAHIHSRSLLYFWL